MLISDLPLARRCAGGHGTASSKDVLAQRPRGLQRCFRCQGCCAAGAAVQPIALAVVQCIEEVFHGVWAAHPSFQLLFPYHDVTACGCACSCTCTNRPAAN
jgi:hypothetical protein